MGLIGTARFISLRNAETKARSCHPSPCASLGLMSKAPSANLGGVDPVSRDFAATPDPPSATLAPAGSQQPGNREARYVSAIDPGIANPARSGLGTDPSRSAFARSDTDFALSPDLRRRTTRAGTFRTVDDFHDFTVRPGWHRMSILQSAALYLA